MGNVMVTVDAEIDMATYSFEGETRYDDIRVEIDRYYDGKVTQYKICDFSKADLHLSSREVILLAEQVRTRGVVRKRGFDAIVVPNLLYYGLARMYITYAEFAHHEPEALKLMVYRTMEEADASIRWFMTRSKAGSGML